MIKLYRILHFKTRLFAFLVLFFVTLYVVGGRLALSFLPDFRGDLQNLLEQKAKEVLTVPTTSADQPTQNSKPAITSEVHPRSVLHRPQNSHFTSGRRSPQNGYNRNNRSYRSNRQVFDAVLAIQDHVDHDTLTDVLRQVAVTSSDNPPQPLYRLTLASPDSPRHLRHCPTTRHPRLNRPRRETDKRTSRSWQRRCARYKRPNETS